MGKSRLRWIKSKRWVRRFFKITWEGSLAPITDGNARLQVIALVILLILLLPPRGYEKWVAQMRSTWEVLEPFLYAFPIFVLLNAFSAIFKVSKQERELGSWHGACFIYHQPQHVSTLLITAADNDATHNFHVTDPEIGSIVEVLVSIDRQDERVKAQVVWPRGQNLLNWEIINKNSRTSLLLPEDRLLALRTYAVPEATPTTIRVYLLSWKVN